MKSFQRVSVVIPARNERRRIGSVVSGVLAQRGYFDALEVIVVDDGSTDDTSAVAERAGAKVLRLGSGASMGNPARARNHGAQCSTGDPIVFLDSDCVPKEGWLQALLDAHLLGATLVGGALDMPDGLPWTARADYYSGWYLQHSSRPAQAVRHHPPPSLSVRRQPFLGSSMFVETPPLFYTNEERRWQSELRRQEHKFVFAPSSVALHHNRPGLKNLLTRSYRWGYTALESKSETGSTRLPWLFSNPLLLIGVSPVLPIAITAYALCFWARSGRFEPFLLSPIIFLSRVAYVMGMVIGGARWLRARTEGIHRARPAPRWN